MENRSHERQEGKNGVPKNLTPGWTGRQGPNDENKSYCDRPKSSIESPARLRSTSIS